MFERAFKNIDDILEFHALQKIIDAGKSDLFDVLEFIAYSIKPITREARGYQCCKTLLQDWITTKKISLNLFSTDTFKQGWKIRAGKAAAFVRIKISFWW